MLEHYKALEFDKVLENLSKYASSSIAKTAIKNLDVYSEQSKIEYELTLVEQARRIIDNTQKSLPLEEILDVDSIFKQNYLEPREIIELTNNLKSARLTRNFITKEDNIDNLSEIAKNLYINKVLEEEIFSTFDNELNVVDSASNTLKALRSSYRDNKENLKSAISTLLNNPQFSSYLQDTIVSTRDNRPVFQVKASDKNKVQGIVHDISSTNLTYFIEPSSLVPLSNKLRQIEIEIKAEIDRIILILSSKLKEIKEELSKNQKLLTKLDIVFAKAKYSIHLKAQKPQLIKEKIIDIQAMRHPILVEVKDNIVENDFILGKTYNCLLITGSNTGGKTIALKTAGLLTLMTKAGLFIPCLGAKIYPYKNIFCDISKEQSLEQGFSTFSAHIKNIKDILDNIDDNSLVLLDELGSGTDPIEGASLAQAILEFIKEKNTQAVITTHLGELKALKYSDSYFENATVLFDIKTLKPKYNLIIGMSGTSNAIDISSELGLKESIITRAREVLLNNNSDSSKLFIEIEKTNQNLIEKEQKTKIVLQEAKNTNEQYEKKLKELKQNKKKSLENFKKKFQSQLEAARSEIKEIVEEIRKEKSLKVALRSYDKLNRIENKTRQEFSIEDDNLSEKYPKLDSQQLKIGQNVLIKKLNQVAILDSLPDKKGVVTIRIGNIQSKVKIKDLAKTDKKIEPHLKKVQVNFDNTESLLSRLDLRGMRAIDAVEYLDEKLDKASLRGLNQITVIHGFGSGALKQAINDYLKNSPYVSKYRYAGENEGREGVTIIDLV